MGEFDVIKRYVFVLSVLAWSAPAYAAAKLDKETCDQLRAEKVTFAQSGILGDFEKGADWGKANLSADRLREVEHFILLDEQLKFGCREAILTLDAKAAADAAQKIELNPDADPTAPDVPEAATPAGSDSAAAAPVTAPKTHQRVKPAPKPKAKDAYAPPPGTGTTLDEPRQGTGPDLKTP